MKLKAQRFNELTDPRFDQIGGEVCLIKKSGARGPANVHYFN